MLKVIQQSGMSFPCTNVALVHSGSESREGVDFVLQPPDGPPPGFAEAGKAACCYNNSADTPVYMLCVQCLSCLY